LLCPDIPFFPAEVFMGFVKNLQRWICAIALCTPAASAQSILTDNASISSRQREHSDHDNDDRSILAVSSSSSTYLKSSLAVLPSSTPGE
jgi:hypothetical protein